jgi:hypothetical protein
VSGLIFDLGLMVNSPEQVDLMREASFLRYYIRLPRATGALGLLAHSSEPHHQTRLCRQKGKKAVSALSTWV